MNKEFVPSVKRPAQIEVSGFDQANDGAHMIEWLGKGLDFRKFVVADIETELYGQDGGAQLLSVECSAKPEYETRLLRHEPVPQKAIVAQVTITFPISLRVRATNGAVWTLKVWHAYEATHLDQPANRKLRLNFTVVSQSST